MLVMCIVQQFFKYKNIQICHKVRPLWRGIVVFEKCSIVLKFSRQIFVMFLGKTLKCFGMMLPRSVARKIRLLFTWLGDYVMVHAHRYFTHLLNVGIEIQPCHHILWHGEFFLMLFCHIQLWTWSMQISLFLENIR